jgi:hypothetical protein
MLPVRRAISSAHVIAAALLLSSVVAHAQPVPSAADVVARHVAAIGGKDALMKVTSVKQVATMELPGMGLSAQMEMYMAAPNKVFTKASLAGVGDLMSGTDGTVAWEINPMQGPRVLTDKEFKQALEQADFYGNILLLADRFSLMENTGVVDFAGEKAYKLRLVRKDSGRETTQYFSVATGLALGSESTSETQMGTTQSITTLREYKTFGGLLFATKSEVQMGPQKIVATITDVVINGAPDAVFAVPAAVQPLIKK